jgi:Gamma tubulin complex component N-terminal
MLLKAASVPYFEVLTTWVSSGTLNDPCSEFMVVAVPGMNVDMELDGQSAFWVGGHKLRTVIERGEEVSDVPMFLHAVEDEVLKAG